MKKSKQMWVNKLKIEYNKTSISNFVPRSVSRITFIKYTPVKRWDIPSFHAYIVNFNQFSQSS